MFLLDGLEGRMTPEFSDITLCIKHFLIDLEKNPEGRLIESYHILGDSAFPVSPQVITPFKRLPNQDLNAVQKKFNRHLSSKRNVRTLSLVMFLYSFNTCEIV